MSKLVYVVDDEAAIGSLCQDLLSESYDVRAFTNPLESIKAMAGSERPQLVLTDLKMPEIDGFEFAGQLRKLDPHVPIIMFSGCADKDHLLEALSREFAGFLEKPFDPGKLVSLVELVLARASVMSKMRDLIGAYHRLSGASIELNQKYVQRYAKAENALYELGMPQFQSNEGVKQLLAEVRAENELEREIESHIGRIKDILGRHPELLMQVKKRPKSDDWDDF